MDRENQNTGRRTMRLMHTPAMLFDSNLVPEENKVENSTINEIIDEPIITSSSIYNNNNNRVRYRRRIIHSDQQFTSNSFN